MRGRGVDRGLTRDNGGNSERGDRRGIVSRRVKKKEQKSRGDTSDRRKGGCFWGGVCEISLAVLERSRKILHSKLAATA